jgi:hypothetical protein
MIRRSRGTYPLLLLMTYVQRKSIEIRFEDPLNKRKHEVRPHASF